MAQDDSRGPATSAGRFTIGVPKETMEGENRVSLIPDSVSKLAGENVDIVVESGAGDGSSISDDEYREAGATVLPDAASVYERADLIIKVQAPQRNGEASSLKSGQSLVSLLAPLVNHDLVNDLASGNVTSFAMDAVPRITRAQSMDALSAMSTIGGYKAVLLAANHLPKFFPLLMTAAGTIKPAKVLVLGAGVAGLQAIATARRLGAVVEAYDTRPVVKEQVESLGAKFVEIDTGSSDTQTAGGYAREATAEELQRQQEGLNAHIAQSDVVITTALVPGRPAPKLIPASAVEAMSTGSVIVDLAAETGGNCELTVPGEVVTREGVTVIGLLNLPSLLPLHASQMYSRVVQNFLALLLQDGKIDLNLEDEVIQGMCITNNGEVIQEQTRKAMNLGEAPTPAVEPAPEPEPDLEVGADEPGVESVVIERDAGEESGIVDELGLDTDVVAAEDVPTPGDVAQPEPPEPEIESVVIEDDAGSTITPEEAREDSEPIESVESIDAGPDDIAGDDTGRTQGNQQ